MRPLLALLFLSIASVNLMAQTQPANEIALDYTYLHTNAPPGGCGCFSDRKSTRLNSSHRIASRMPSSA